MTRNFSVSASDDSTVFVRTVVGDALVAVTMRMLMRVMRRPDGNGSAIFSTRSAFRHFRTARRQNQVRIDQARRYS